MPRSRNPARRRLSAVLNREVPVVLVLGAVAWLAPGPVSRLAGWVMVGVLIITPIARVGWLAVRWMGFDRRFAWAGWALLGAVAAATVAAAVLR
jgi:hypothetical protein